MDQSEIESVRQYMATFGHAPPGITPEHLQLIQALQAAKARAPSTPTTPVPSYNHATPGVSGAIHDAVNAVAKAAAPKSITQQPARMAAQEAANQ